MIKYSFVIPCYGSEDTISDVINEIVKMMEMRPLMVHDQNYEIIAINDCSPDNVWDVLQNIQHNNPNLRLLEMARNMNRPGAVMAGLNNAVGDIVIVMDDDGQCPIEHLWELIEPLERGADVSIAKYNVRKQNLFKEFGTVVNRRMTEYVLDKPRNLVFSNFMAIKRNVVNEMIKYKNPYPYMTGLLLRCTKHIVNVQMDERSRFDNKSTTFTLKKLLSLWMNGLTAFSVKPLRIASLLGVMLALFGFLFGIYLIIRKLIHPQIEVGYSSIMVSIVVIGGLIMMMLGIIGEYLGRVYICINRSPQYVIRKRVGFDKKDEQ